MDNFTVIHSDNPSSYREKILEFWREYLPGTSPGRFDWMLRGNPAGSTDWFFAFAEETGELAGTVSLMPKMLNVDGRWVRVGISGDFMVDKKYRIFGPNLKLMRTLVNSAPALGYEFVYSVPNDASIKISDRVGMKLFDSLSFYVKPIQLTFYLKRRLPALLADLVAIPVGLTLKLFSKELFVSSKGVEEVRETDESFDILWEKLRSSVTGLVSDRRASFLSWRYFENPLNKFRLLVCRNKAQSDLSGYAVFCIGEDNKLWIYDIVSIRKGVEDRLLKRVIGIAREAHCQSVIFSVSCRSDRGRIFRHFGFFKPKYKMELHCTGDHELPLDSWEFFSGDRNI